MRQSVAGKDVNTIAEASMEVGAVTKHRLVKTQHIEKNLVGTTLNCKVHELTTVCKSELQLRFIRVQ
jgi:hypothetical protein